MFTCYGCMRLILCLMQAGLENVRQSCVIDIDAPFNPASTEPSAL